MKQKKMKICFFTHEPNNSILREQYTLNDIRIIKEFGYDIIISNNFFNIPNKCDLYFSWWASGSILPLIKAKISRKKIIVIAGGNEATLTKDSITNAPIGYLNSSWIKKIATRITLKLADVVLPVSRYMYSDTVKLGAKNPIVVHNCVDTVKFDIKKCERKYVTSVFKLDKNVIKLKRGIEFIKSIPYVLKKFPEQKFVIIGEKSNGYPDLIQLCDELKIMDNVIFTGSIKNDDMINWLQHSKVYVQISDMETFGLAVAEAMSCGTQVVVSDRGAIPEVVGNNGVYVDHNDPKSISKGIVSVLNKSDEQYEEQSKSSREFIEKNFSYRKRKEEIKNIINKLLD